MNKKIGRNNMNREDIVEEAYRRFPLYSTDFEMMQRSDVMWDGFVEGAEWMQEQAHKEFLEANAEIEKQHVQDVENMIERACEWWSNHATEYLIIDIDPSRYKPPRYIISSQAKIDYVKAMKGE